jgi:hypothetical protein
LHLQLGDFFQERCPLTLQLFDLVPLLSDEKKARQQYLHDAAAPMAKAAHFQPNNARALVSLPSAWSAARARQAKYDGL